MKKWFNDKVIENYENEPILIVKELVKKEKIGEQEIIHFRWFIANEEINLGSLKEPNSKILEVMYLPRKDIGHYFKEEKE